MRLARSARRGVAIAVLMLGLFGLARGAGRDSHAAHAAAAPGAARRPRFSTADSIRALTATHRYAAAESTALTALIRRADGRAPSTADSADLIDALVDSRWWSGRESTPGTLELAARALAIRAPARARSPLRYASSLENYANLISARGKTAEAHADYERVLALRRGRMPPDSPEIASALHGLGRMEYNEARFPEARRHFEAALAIRMKQLGPRSVEVGRSLNALGSTLMVLDDLPAADSVFTRALALREQTLPPNHPDIAWSVNNLSLVRSAEGNLASAQELAERGLAIAERAAEPDQRQVAIALQRLGYARRSMGDYSGARPLFLRSREILERPGSEASDDYVQALRVEVDNLRDLGDFETAEPLIRHALEIDRQRGSPGNGRGPLLTALGAVLDGQGRLEDAHAVYEEVLRYDEQHSGAVSRITSVSVGNLAANHYDRGDYAAAESLFARAVRIDEQLLGPRHLHLGIPLSGLARARLARGDVAGARELFDRALAIREQVLGPDHPLVAEILHDRAVARARLGDREGALGDALRAERIGRDHFHLMAQSLSEREALRFEAVRASGLDLAVSLASDSLGLTPALRRSVWDALIRSRGLVLDEMAERQRATRAGDAESRRRIESLATARRNLIGVLLRGPGAQPPERYLALLRERRAAVDVAEREMAARTTKDPARRSETSVGFDSVAAALPNGSALIAYVHIPPPDHSVSALDRRGFYAAFVLRAAERVPDVVRLGEANAIESAVARWSRETAQPLPRGSAAERVAEARCREAGEAVRRAVWDPIARYLGAAPSVLIVPDGPLQLANFAALPDGGGRYLIETGPLVNLLTVERDVVREPSRTSGRGLLAVGGARFDAALSAAPSGDVLAAVQPAERGTRSARSGCVEFRRVRFAPLPASRIEADEIAALWRGSRTGPHADAVVLSDSLATKSALMDLAPGRDVLHLATHGFFIDPRCTSAGEGRGIGGMAPSDRSVTGLPATASGDARVESPLLLSGLALAGANQREAAGAGADDGILTAEEISLLDLSACDWAVLSGCDTGLGALESGEGVFGLRRAFRIAGARSVIMSLWTVDDQSARDWMSALYRHRLVEHVTTPEAVRAASLDLLRQRRASGLATHPHAWAAFIAAGDGR